MSLAPEQILIYHITDVTNLPSILAAGGLRSDAAMSTASHQVIGYNHIKERRLKEIQVACCGGRFVGEFVPFYFCPRSPMLYTINQGNTGLSPACQSSIVHLVSTVALALGVGRDWAVSDGNAGARHTSFYANLNALDSLDWAAIRATDWRGRIHEKSAEFLVADFFPLTGIETIGCHNSTIVQQVQSIIAHHGWLPALNVEPNWYY
jgi:hypothetical protein